MDPNAMMADAVKQEEDRHLKDAKRLVQDALTGYIRDIYDYKLDRVVKADDVSFMGDVCKTIDLLTRDD